MKLRETKVESKKLSQNIWQKQTNKKHAQIHTHKDTDLSHLTHRCMQIDTDMSTYWMHLQLHSPRQTNTDMSTYQIHLHSARPTDPDMSSLIKVDMFVSVDQGLCKSHTKSISQTQTDPDRQVH